MSVIISDLPENFKHCFAVSGNTIKETVAVLNYISNINEIKNLENCSGMITGKLTKTYLDIFIGYNDLNPNNLYYVYALLRNYSTMSISVIKESTLVKSMIEEINQVEKELDEKNNPFPICHDCGKLKPEIIFNQLRTSSSPTRTEFGLILNQVITPLHWKTPVKRGKSAQERLDDLAREAQNVRYCSSNNTNYISFDEWTRRKANGENLCNYLYNSNKIQACANTGFADTDYKCSKHAIVKKDDIPYISLEEWDTRKEQGEKLCEWAPPRGRNHGKICSNPVCKTVEDRCKVHRGMKGIIERIRTDSGLHETKI